MKKKLLIIALFICFGNISAQANATLQETINWLNKYGVALIKVDKADTAHELEFNKYQIRIYRVSKNIGERAESYQLKDIRKIEVDRAYENSEICTVKIVGSGTLNSEYRYLATYIHFNNKEDAYRFYKALKHLFSFYNYEINFKNTIELENKF